MEHFFLAFIFSPFFSFLEASGPQMWLSEIQLTSSVRLAPLHHAQLSDVPECSPPQVVAHAKWTPPLASLAFQFALRESISMNAARMEAILTPSWHHQSS